MDLGKIRQLVNNLQDGAELAISVGGKPLIHHLMNTYWISRDVQTKTSVCDLVLLCIEKGMVVDAPAQGEPDALHKALLMREMRLAREVVRASRKLQIDAVKLYELYSVPCNPTPSAKLLLHADTINQKMNKGQKQDLDAFKKLLFGAHREGQRPVVQARELSALSATNEDMLTMLAYNSSGEVTRAAIVDGLSEAAGFVHAEILAKYRRYPVELARALAQVIQGGRNSLHMLAVSGGTSMIKDLSSYMHDLDAAVLSGDADKQIVQEAKEVIAAALNAMDYRQKTPLQYAAIRYDYSYIMDAVDSLATSVGIDVGTLSAAHLCGTHLAPVRNTSSAVKESADMLGDMEVHMARRRILASVRGSLGGWSPVRVDDSIAGDIDR
jgi:2-polyprenyl-3-methyl-5-hydroxy-6-metoxy-1,4-benzoquinol methylase